MPSSGHARCGDGAFAARRPVSTLDAPQPDRSGQLSRSSMCGREDHDPVCAEVEIAALTIASTCCVVISPSTALIRTSSVWSCGQPQSRRRSPGSCQNVRLSRWLGSSSCTGHGDHATTSRSRSSNGSTGQPPATPLRDRRHPTTTNATAPRSSTTSSNKRNHRLDNDHRYNAGYGTLPKGRSV